MPLRGTVQVPTLIPAFGAGFQQLLPGAPELPNYQLSATVSIEDPVTGQKTPIATTSQLVKLGNPITIPVSFNTRGMRQDRYNYWLTVRDAYGNTLFDNIIYPRAVYLMSAGDFGLPTIEGPTLTAPTAYMMGTPSLNIPNSVTYGDIWRGSVTLPTRWPPGIQVPLSLPSLPLTLLAQLETPTKQRYNVASLVPSFQPGQTIDIPVNFNTSQLPGAGPHGIYLFAKDLQGNNLLPGGDIGYLLGMLNILTAAGLPVLPTTVPTAPTAEMLKTPTISAPTSVKYGETWSGGVTIPTTWPASLPTPPSMPSLPLSLQAQLETPTGQRFNVVSPSPSFKPGETINLPFSFNTSQLPGPDTEKILLFAKDPQGNNLLPGGAQGFLLGMLNVLTAAGAMPPIPAVNLVAIGQVTASPQFVDPGNTVTITVPLSSKFPTPTTFAVIVEIKRAGTFFTAGPLITTLSKNVNLNPNESQDVQFTYIASDTGGPTANNIASRHVGVGIYLAGVAVRTNLTDNPHEFDDVFGVRVAAAGPAVAPQLTAAISVQQGSRLAYSWIGFQPNATLNISVQGGGHLTGTSNFAGAGSGSFTDNDPPGTYTLVAEDNYGHKATAQFTVTAAPAVGSVTVGGLSASPSVVDPGGIVTLSVPITSNFSATTIFAVTFEIKRAGTAWAAGPTIIRTGKGVSLKPGETQNVQIQYTANDTGGPTANNIASRHVGIGVTAGGVAVRTNYVDNPHEFDDVFGVRITPAPAAAASKISVDSSVQQGSRLSYSWIGFQPNQSIRIYVQGGGGLTATSNFAGIGSGSFTDNDPPGTYTLVAEDSYGHKATAPFTVTAVAAPAAAAPKLDAINSPDQGTALQFSWSGFLPNAVVRIYVQGGGGLNLTSDSRGAGSGSFINNDPPGTYTLVAADSYGHRATTTFKVT